jgi:hypothetical protein
MQVPPTTTQELLDENSTLRQRIAELELLEAERQKLISELREAMSNIKTLKGMLPICAWCKKIRDASGNWETIEFYVKDHSEAQFTHRICPECLQRSLSELQGYVLSNATHDWHHYQVAG